MIYEEISYNSRPESGELVLFEAKKLNSEKDVKEIMLGTIFSKVILDYKSKSIKIKGINYEKFLLRIKEMYESKKISNLFGINYTKLSEIMYKKEKIHKKDMKITNLEVPLFFALEVYRIFLDMGTHYNLGYYKKVADQIYKHTWISNYEKRNKIHIDCNMKNLKNLNFEPEPYQREFIDSYQTLKYVYDLDGYILSFDQGLGKTFTAISIYETMPYKISQVIIVAPSDTLQANWALEIKKYYKKYSDDDLWREEVFVYNNKNFKYTPNTKFVIINMDSIPKIYQYAKKQDVMIIVDECHNFRNMDSDRSKALLELKRITGSKDCLPLSGTPIKATPDEIIPSLMLIDPYFTMDMALIYKKTFNDNSVLISNVCKARYGRIIYRKLKDEVLRLPNKNILDLRLPLKNWQLYTSKKISMDTIAVFLQVYEEKYKNISSLMEEYNILVRRYSSATITLTNQYLKYINLTTQTDKELYIHEHRFEVYKSFLTTYVYPNITDPNIAKRLKYCESQYIYMKESAMGIALGRIRPPAFNNVFMSLYEEHKDRFIDMIKNNTKKTVIFSPFLTVVKHINESLNDSGVGSVEIIGETKERMEIINQFKSEDTIDVLCATVQTLSTGVTLTEASQMFFFGVPYRDADFSQACDRIYRLGQTVDVNIYKVLLESPEPNITERLNDIMNWSGQMFNAVIS